MIFDVIVIGGGHAGIEAATASARRGANTLLLTNLESDIGELSCNPSIGGPGKSQLISEIDVLGGLTPTVSDSAAIHTRILNSSRGSATQALRHQIDRNLYHKNMINKLKDYKNLSIYYEKVISIDIKNKKINNKYKSKSIVITTGTFLNGLIHRGKEKIKSGRLHTNNFYQESDNKISKILKNTGLQIKRFKTGTPARLYKSSINFSLCEEQKPDTKINFFSHIPYYNKQISCYITHTNDKTHEILTKNIFKAPMYNGDISGTGPRYCPSIEDKIMRFKEHNSHHVFLEPEGINSDLIYPNGISTSFSCEIQEEFIRTIKGLENVKIKNYGYAIEYDVIDSRKLKKTLEHKDLDGFFFAGQINGTSGYEEASAQGIIAGINAAAHSLNIKPIILDRTNSIIGVLIDDITTIGIDEPYRMFTSRCEYRLFIRSDNAIIRLGEISKSFDLINDEIFNKKLEQKKEEIYKNDKLYEGYINIAKREIKKYKKDMLLKIPDNFNYNNISGLTNELKEKLNYIKPENIASLSKIRGMTPAGIIIILHKLKNN